MHRLPETKSWGGVLATQSHEPDVQPVFGQTADKESGGGGAEGCEGRRPGDRSGATITAAATAAGGWAAVNTG